MKSFNFRAYTADGQRKSGLIVAEDTADASRKLRQDGLFPEEISAQQAEGSGLRAGRVRRLDEDMQAVFARQLAVLLSAGLPVSDALEVIQTAGTSRAMDHVTNRVRALVLEGAPLSEALDKGKSGFPPYVTSAVRAGEASRDVATVFETIAEHLETRRTDRAALATALIYPAFVAAASLVICGILMATVAPEIARMFEATGRPLPALTETMLAVSGWIGRNVVPLAVAAMVLAIGVPALLRRPAVRDRWHGLLLRLPVIGRLLTLDAAAQYLRTLSLVIASRQPVVTGVRNAADVLQIRRFRADAEAVTREIQAGAPLSAGLKQAGFVPPVARQLVEAGERSASLARMTERAAVLVETWLVNDRKRLATVLDPALMMLVGAFVLVIVLSILLPIFDLQGAIGS